MEQYLPFLLILLLFPIIYAGRFIDKKIKIFLLLFTGLFFIGSFIATENRTDLLFSFLAFAFAYRIFDQMNKQKQTV